MQSSFSGSIKRTRSIFFEAVEQKCLIPPFYDIIFFLIPLFSQLFLLNPPRFHQPPRELKNDNSPDRYLNNFQEQLFGILKLRKYQTSLQNFSHVRTRLLNMTLSNLRFNV